MFSIAMKTLRANLSRFIATLVAIAIGVAFLVAGNMLTTSIRNSLGGEIDRQYEHVDAAVTLRNEELAGSGLMSGAGIDKVLVETISALPHVEAAIGDISGMSRFAEDAFADDLSIMDMQGLTVRPWYDNDLNPVTIVEGRPPKAEGEVTFDRGTMKDRELSLGDTASLTSLSGAVDVTVVGVTSFGTTDSVDSTGTVMAAPDWAFTLGANAEQTFTRVLVQSDGTVSQGEFAESIRVTLPDGFTAVTGDTFRESMRSVLNEVLNVLGPVLTGFSLLALFVCGFVIFNTFSVVVQQRTRELALMRAVAATPRQIRRSLRLEGFGIGLIGSVIGLLLGTLLTVGLTAVLNAFDLDLPPASIVITPGIVITAFAAGIIVTMVSVLIPAWRAGRTAPVEAMREAAIERNRLGRIRLGAAVVLFLAGVGLCLTRSGWFVGIGAFLLVIGVFLSGPALTVLVAWATRPLVSLTGTPGRLSSENLSRNPKRTATTMNALVIGVMLVTLVSIAGNSLKSTVLSYVEDQQSTDVYVGAMTGAISPEMVEEIEAVDGVETSVRIRQYNVTIDGAVGVVSTTDDLSALSRLGITPVSMSWDELGDRAVSLPMDANSMTLGPKTITNALGTSITVELADYLESTFDAGSLGYVLSPELFDEIAPADNGVNYMMIAFEPTRKSEATREIKEITQGLGNIFVFEGNIFGRIIESVFNFLINAVNGLLGMSVVIALIGLVNTLSLSIFERRRELGLLRAVGMTRREVRRMVRFEAVQMSLLGTIIGLASGALVAWLLLRATELADIAFGWKQLAGIFVLGIVLGVVAAIAPTRRASRLDILDAVKVE